jgi:hypothetical protein
VAELVANVYQAFFYRSLPDVAETAKGRAAWKYDSAITFHRACASDSQEAILVRARSKSELPVAKVNLNRALA